MRIRLGSRGSALALWQARFVKARLEAAHPGLEVAVEILHTTGDRIQDVPLARIGDKGLFTKEIDGAILDGRVDLAVHSLKDVPTRLPDGIALGAVLAREDPRDAFVPAPGRPATLEALPPGARVGTSSLRRRAQLLHLRPDLEVQDLRGNLDTRLARVAAGDYDAVILALAGIRRLGRADAVASTLEPPGWLPAAGQGALGIAIRADDRRTRDLLLPLEDAAVRDATDAERAFLHALEGGCQIPIGALARIHDGDLRLHGFVASLDGRAFLRDRDAGPAGSGAAVGERLAARLRRQGADDILRTVRGVDLDRLPRASAP